MGAGIAIVAMSGTAVQADVDAVLAAGADDFVRKPLDFDDLWERVDYAVRKHQQQSKGSTMVTERALGGVAESLRGVPQEELALLASLALEGDISALRESVAALAAQHPQAATALEPIVRAFRYEDLVELCGGGGGS